MAFLKKGIDCLYDVAGGNRMAALKMINVKNHGSLIAFVQRMTPCSNYIPEPPEYTRSC